MASLGRYLLTGVSALLTIAPAIAQSVAVTAEEVNTLRPFNVTSSSLSTLDTATPDGVTTYDAGEIDSSGSFSVDDFLQTLPPAQQGAEQLFLIDGRETYLDPNALPIGMIAGIEVSRDGSMPQYGAYADGQVINLKLKPDYASQEIGMHFEGAFAGGGAEQRARFAGAINREQFKLIYAVEHRSQDSLRASERSFSAQQDHRYRGGRDLRLPWGHPAVIQSLDQPLIGISFDPDPSNQLALVPPGQNGSLLDVADFLPADPTLGQGASGQRRFNSADYRWLIAPRESTTLNLGFERVFANGVRFSASGSAQHGRSKRIGPPPVTAASDGLIVPAAFNPFGQDVAFGMVHTGFGATRRQVEDQREQVGLELAGDWSETWEWNLSLGHRRQLSRQVTPELDPAKLASSLMSVDPADRFNPFADETFAATHSALYPRLSSDRLREYSREESQFEIDLEGRPFDLPGGPVQVDFNAEWESEQRTREDTRTLGVPTTPSSRTVDQQDARVYLRLPFVGRPNARPALQRLDARLAVRGEWASDDARETYGEAGLAWAPWKALVLKGRVRRGEEIPAQRTTAGSEVRLGDVLIDRQRNDTPVTGVRVFNEEVVLARPETTDRWSLGFDLEPPALPGLEFGASYEMRQQYDVFEDDFEPQEIINNESALGSRIVRALPSLSDQAAGLPGPITAIEVTPGHTGSAELQEIEYDLSYRLQLPSDKSQWRLRAWAVQTLEARYEILPGVPFVTEGGGRYQPPPWQLGADLHWSNAAWSFSGRVRHQDPVPAGPGLIHGIGAYSTLDLNATWRHRFKAGTSRRRDLKLTLGLGNVFDAAPPWADTISGHRGGSVLGRTYTTSAVLEF